MANRSPFLRSACLVILIALCFGAIGAVQATPMRYNLTEKSMSHRMLEHSYAQVPGKNILAPVSYSRAGMEQAAASWRQDILPPGSGMGNIVQGTALSARKSPFNVNFTIPEWTHVVIPVKDRVFNPLVPKSHIVSGTGTVVYVDLEGGFYGIIADDGTHYLPDSLPQSCKADGIRVQFKGMEKTTQVSTSMWGASIRILSAIPLGEELKAEGRVEFIDLEGGFYGIVTTDGRSYQPLNLPREYCIDGILVSFTARTVPDTAGITMWGIPISLISITGKSAQDGSSGDSLIGQWTLAGMAKGGMITPLIPGKVITAEFTDNGHISGTSGCNLYSAQYQSRGHSLAIGNAASTEMYCMSPDGIMEQESTYLGLLGEASSWMIRDGKLVILDASGQEILVFSAGVADPSGQKEPLVEFWRSGGFAGMNDHLKIYHDGSVSLTRKEYSVGFTLSEADLEAISTLLEGSGFMALSPEYRAPPGSADLFLYQVHAYGKTVLVEDTVIPESLQPLIEALTRLVAENGPDDVAPPRVH